MNLQNAVFLGSKALGLAIFNCLGETTPGLKWALVHPDDKADGRSELAAFQALAGRRGFPLEIVASPAEARAVLARTEADIGFVCGWYWLLDRVILERFPHGLWGIHNSLLPKYRGGAPLVWSIINGDRQVGSSVFRISEGMDDGPILHQVRTDLGREDTIAEVLSRIEAALVDELPPKWRDLVEGRADLQEQHESDATYCGQRCEDDGLIDWTRSALEVHDFIRAQARPYPCAFSYVTATKLRIARSRPVDAIYFGTPGQVLRRNERSIVVSCGQSTALEVLSVIVDGEDAVPSQVVKSVNGRFSTAPRNA